jgi:two-component sensor histidine kinase
MDPSVNDLGRDGGEPARTGSPYHVSAERGAGLVRALSNTGISVLYCDPQLRIIWAENVTPIWSREDVCGKSEHDFLPPDMAERLLASKRTALSTGRPQRLEVSVPEPNGIRWFSLCIDTDLSADGVVLGLITTACDITEQKWREQTLRTLLREVAHRSKNLLAIIQSIATQTGRHSVTIDGFLSRFRGRIQSLASTQDLVTSSNWRGADLYELVVGQVGRYTADPVRSIRYDGERPYLNPNAALHIGLALHELAVNSVSYGALARPDGTVAIDTVLSTDGESPGLSMIWTETISIGDQEIGQKRFGSVALEKVVPASLNGVATLSISSEQLSYHLLIPVGNFEIE